MKRENKGKILTLRKRSAQETEVSNSEVTRNLFSDVWKENVDEIRTATGSIQSEKLGSIPVRSKTPEKDEEKAQAS